jgi:hypothetical protein
MICRFFFRIQAEKRKDRPVNERVLGTTFQQGASPSNPSLEKCVACSFRMLGCLHQSTTTIISWKSSWPRSSFHTGTYIAQYTYLWPWNDELFFLQCINHNPRHWKILDTWALSSNPQVQKQWPAHSDAWNARLQATPH